MIISRLYSKGISGEQKLNKTGWPWRHSDRQATAVNQWDAKLCGSLAQILVQMLKKDQNAKPGAVRMAKKKWKLILFHAVCQISFSGALTLQARWPCRRVELSCDLFDPEERVLYVTADWRKSHLVPYLHLPDYTNTVTETHFLWCYAPNRQGLM